MKSVNSLFANIYNRSSVREFRSDPVPERILLHILESARWAPSGGNAQPWSFGIVRDEQRKRALAKAAGGQMWIADAPVVVACCGKLQTPDEESEFSRTVNELRWGKDVTKWLYENSYGRGLLFSNVATHIPGAHIQLAAQAYGIGSCWIGYMDIAQTSEILHLPEEWRCYFLMPLGYPAEQSKPKQSRHSLADITFCETFDIEWESSRVYPSFGEPVMREYKDTDEEEWLNVWGQVAVTSWAWVIVNHVKPDYKKESLELVAVQNGEIVGFMDVEVHDKGYNKERPCGFVWEFGVRPDCRRRGIATRMIKTSEQWLVQRGIRCMEFWSADEKAQDFYRYYGMTEMERHWQFFTRLPESVTTVMRQDDVGLHVAYCSGPLNRLKELVNKYRILTDCRHEPKVCVGFEHEW